MGFIQLLAGEVNVKLLFSTNIHTQTQKIRLPSGMNMSIVKSRKGKPEILEKQL